MGTIEKNKQLARTDIDAVKKVLLRWLYLPYISRPELGGLFSNHPIIDSAVLLNNELTIVNDETIRDVRQMFTETIESRNYATILFMMVKKPYRLSFFCEVSQYLSVEDYNEILSWVYKDIEYPNYDNDVEELVNHFEIINRDLFMDEEDKQMYENLPTTFTVYRGIRTEDYYDALSWTTDIDTAKWFAQRFNHNGFVATATINKEDVYCCYTQESEVVVNPHRIQIEEILPVDQAQVATNNMQDQQMKM